MMLTRPRRPCSGFRPGTASLQQGPARSDRRSEQEISRGDFEGRIAGMNKHSQFCWEAVALFPQGHRDVDSWDELVRIDIDAVEVSTMGGGHFRLMAGQYRVTSLERAVV